MIRRVFEMRYAIRLSVSQLDASAVGAGARFIPRARTSSRTKSGRCWRRIATTVTPRSRSGGLRVDSREGSAEGREVGSGDGAGRSRQEPADPGRPADRRSQDAEGREAEARRSGGAGRMGQDGRAVAGYCKAVPSTLAPSKVITPEQRAFWSFQPLKEPAIPAVRKNPGRRRISITLFWRSWRAKGMKPVAPADRRTLIRRATLDLIGLAADARRSGRFRERQIAEGVRKGGGPPARVAAYGERWGRHWLDVARYAEDDVRGLDPKGRGYMPFRRRVRLSRLGDSGVQRRHALRRVRRRRSWPAI